MHSPSHKDALVLELWHGEVWADCPSTERNLCELYCYGFSSVHLGFKPIIIPKRFKPFPAVLVLLFFCFVLFINPIIIVLVTLHMAHSKTCSLCPDEAERQEAAMEKALKIKRSSIYPVLDLKALIPIGVACVTVSVPRMSCTNLFVILETERKGGEMWDNLVVLGGRTLDRRCWSTIASSKEVLQLTFHYWDNVKMSENLLQPFQNVWDRICNTGKTPIRGKAMLTLTKISSYYI